MSAEFAVAEKGVKAPVRGASEACGEAGVAASPA